MKSLSITVTAAKQDDCNRLMRGLDRDNAPDPGKTFSVPLSASGMGATTHYGAHTWDDDLIAILVSGNLPIGIIWSHFNITELNARLALNMINFLSVEPSGNSTPEDFDILIGNMGLRRIGIGAP